MPEFNEGEAVYRVRGQSIEKATISRATKTLAIIRNKYGIEVKFNRRTGWRIPSYGNHGSVHYIAHPTPNMDEWFESWQEFNRIQEVQS